MNNHPYIIYAKALLMESNSLESFSDINASSLKEQIIIGLNHFRVIPSEVFENKKTIKFNFSKIEKGYTAKGIYLAPNIIATDKLIRHTWNDSNNIIEKLEKNNLEKLENVTKAISPLSGEFTSFSDKGINRGKPKISLFEMALSLITTLTPYKPCMQDNRKNTAIIPDLPLPDMVNFIRFFKDMLSHKSSNDLFIGKVKPIPGNKKNPTITFKPLRPLLFSGNFPNPPKSTALGGIALLATIGEFAKEAEYSERAKSVLESLKDTTMYLIKYGDAHTFTYNHYIVELAKKGNLRQIVDSIYYSVLHKNGKRNRKDISQKDKVDSKINYQKFDLFASRFLQLFNTASFKDFLAIRAEYPYQLELLFNTYFMKMEKIDSKIVSSARQLGKWLNQVAYFTAKAEIKEGSQNYKEKLREQKAKVLIELESAAFSAKSGDALMAQVITRAGRLSMMDVPSEADLFIESSMNGALSLEQSKNLIIAFSRLKNKFEKSNENKTEEIELESKSNYQDL